MSETAQQYIARVLKMLGNCDPMQVLAATPAKLDQVLATFSKENLWRRPSPNKWSPAEIGIHISEVEMVIGVRVRLVIGTNGISIQGFDQDAWAVRYRNTSVHVALQSFRALRSANLDFYRGLSPEQWEQHGMHSERGKETARRIVELCAGHDLNHLRQLETMQFSEGNAS
jgi:DinB superfamily